MSEDHAFEQGSPLVVALEDLIVLLSKRLENNYKFRFVSTGQSKPYMTALSKWETSGRNGPQPKGTPAEIRAMIYDMSTPNSRLSAFIMVSSIAIFELAETAIRGLRSGRIIVTYTALRGLIERTAHANALADALINIRSASKEGPLTPVLELHETINKALYGTQREWTDVVRADFRAVSAKELKYVRKEDSADYETVNILKSVDKLDRRVKGTRLVYEILCEFLHPNVGDLWASTIDAKSFSDRHGTRHLTRTIGLGVKILNGLPELQIVYSKLQDICIDIVRNVPAPLNDLEETSKVAKVLTRKYAHHAAKNYRQYFANDDICPCLSGLTVKACRRAS